MNICDLKSENKCICYKGYIQYRQALAGNFKNAYLGM